jgi:hypothetical protein
MYIYGFFGGSNNVFKGKIISIHPENNALVLFEIEAENVLLWVLNKVIFSSKEEALLCKG